MGHHAEWWEFVRAVAVLRRIPEMSRFDRVQMAQAQLSRVFDKQGCEVVSEISATSTSLFSSSLVITFGLLAIETTQVGFTHEE